jgi:hypothetical protein
MSGKNLAPRAPRTRGRIARLAVAGALVTSAGAGVVAGAESLSTIPRDSTPRDISLDVTKSLVESGLGGTEANKTTTTTTELQAQVDTAAALERDDQGNEVPVDPSLGTPVAATAGPASVQERGQEQQPR